MQINRKEYKMPESVSGTEPIVFDFGSLSETSRDNCFGCDSCNCDAGQVEHQQPKKTLEQIAATQSLQTGHMVSTVKSHNL